MKGAVTLAVVLWCTAACSHRKAAAIRFATDTLEINTTLVQVVPAFAVDEAGKRMEDPGFDISGVPASLFRTGRRGVQCLQDGVGTITVTAGQAVATSPAKCNIAVRFSPPETVRTMVGAGKMLFRLNAYNARGELLREPGFELKNLDPAILRLERGLVTPQRAGVGRIAANSGRATGVVTYVVAPLPPRQ